MSRRVELQTILENTLGSRNVYFQPPETVKMTYPCIVYSRNSVDATYANNSLYNHKIRYTVMLIDKNPDSLIVDKLLKLPLCSFDRHYAKDNLNHDVFNIYY